MTAVLETIDAAAGYNNHPVVRDVNVVVNSAARSLPCSVPTAPGSTTTLVDLAGRQRVLSGRLLVDGRESRAPLASRAADGLALVTEERSVFMKLTTLQNLRVGRCDIDDALLSFPELGPLLHRPAGQLSGGEQRNRPSRVPWLADPRSCWQMSCL